jgi:rod shape-determining protein MreB
MDQAITDYFKNKYNLMIGERTAEDIKISIGAACFPAELELSPADSRGVQGRNLVSGLPETVTITAEEIKKALQDPIKEIIRAVKSTLANTPPETTADIMQREIILAGGGSLLSGLGQLVEQEIGLPVRLADDPLNCVARGTGKTLEELKNSKDILITPTRLS